MFFTKGRFGISDNVGLVSDALVASCSGLVIGRRFYDDHSAKKMFGRKSITYIRQRINERQLSMSAGLE